MGCNIRIRINLLEALEDFGFDISQMILQRQVAVGIKKCIAGMIVPAMKFLEPAMGQRWNFGGVSAGIKTIRRRWVQRFQDGAHHHLIGGGHGALHFIIDNAFIRQLIGGRVVTLPLFFYLQAVALLLKTEAFQAREKRGVQVNPHQVVEIIFILGRKRIHGPIRGRKGIHKCA